MFVSTSKLFRVGGLFIPFLVCTGLNAVGCGDNKTTGPEPLPPVPEGMVRIPPGTFLMGSPSNELGRNDAETQHQVILTRAFYMFDHEVTQAEWSAVMGTMPSRFRGDNLPVEGTSWLECVNFCNAKSTRECLQPVYTITGDQVTWDHTKNGYRLPTEAEWEYACRAGSTSPFSNGDVTNQNCSVVDVNLDQIGWYCGNAGSGTHEVAGKVANAWGLYDMHGNVMEWCWDWFQYDLGRDAVTNPTGPEFGEARLFRGGFFRAPPGACRSARRDSEWPGFHLSGIGLRLVKTAP